MNSITLESLKFNTHSEKYKIIIKESGIFFLVNGGNLVTYCWSQISNSKNIDKTVKIIQQSTYPKNLFLGYVFEPTSGPTPMIFRIYGVVEVVFGLKFSITWWRCS